VLLQAVSVAVTVGGSGILPERSDNGVGWNIQQNGLGGILDLERLWTVQNDFFRRVTDSDNGVSNLPLEHRGTCTPILFDFRGQHGESLAAVSRNL
jgi:hypothetical protein